MTRVAFYNKTGSSNDRGFTLVEVIIYVAIVGLVMIAFVKFGLAVSTSRNASFTHQEAQTNARFALDQMTGYIRSASGVNIGASTFDTDPGVLSLSTGNVATDPTILQLDAPDGQLTVTEGVGSVMVLSSDEVRVTNLIFRNLTDPMSTHEHIAIEMTIAFDDGGSSDQSFTSEQTVRTAVSVRN